MSYLSKISHLLQGSMWQQNSLIDRSYRSLWLYVFMILLQGIVAYDYAQQLGEVVSVSKCLVRASLWVSLSWVLYVLPRNKWLRRGSLMLGLVFSIFAFVLEEFLLSRYSTVYTVAIAYILAGTNSNEAEEFRQNALPLMVILRPLVTIIMVVGIAVILQWGASKIKSVVFRRYLALSLLVFSSFTILLNVYPSYRTWQKVSVARQAYDYTISSYDRLFWNSLGFYLDYASIKESRDRMRDISIEGVQYNPLFQPHNLVIIIGETLRRDYMHCYGYPLENTPRIDSLLNSGQMAKFDDVVSPAPGTIESLTKIMTMKTLDTHGQWHEYPSLVSILNKYADYSSLWVSNQEASGAFIQPINILAQLANEVRYTNVRSIDSEHEEHRSYFDEDVLPLLSSKRELGLQGHKNFLQVVHLMGSHPVYAKRYPKHFNKFQPADIPTLGSFEKDSVVASYVNSVYYNDFVVGEIIRKYSSEDAIVMYFSDHGEIIYDDPKNPNYHDHGMLPQGLTVPFLVYLSPSMRERHPQLLERLNSYSKRPILLDDFTHAVCDFIGLKSSYTDRRNNFLSPDYDAPKKRVVSNSGTSIVFDTSQGTTN